MDKLVRKIEVPLAKNAVKRAGLYLVPEERLRELADVATIMTRMKSWAILWRHRSTNLLYGFIFPDTLSSASP